MLSDNNQNIKILFNNTKKFVVQNQNVIEIISNCYVKYGLIDKTEQMDMIQYINMRLLESVLAKMQKQCERKYYM